MSDEEEGAWIDITKFGSVYEEQINLRDGRKRHRHGIMGDMHKYLEFQLEHWEDGPAPDMKESK